MQTQHYYLKDKTGEILPVLTEKKLISISNKHRNYWARIRQDIGLCERSELVDEFDLEIISEELRDILESGIITYPPTLGKYGLGLESTFDERKNTLGVVNSRNLPTELEQKFINAMKRKAENGRKANWEWRISKESEEKQKAGWYPFFVTLTIDPRKAELNGTSSEEIWKKGREFRKYIRRLVNVVCKELGHKPAHKTNIPESEYVTYAGVIEHGKTREHHHGHFMVWMREIPNSWKQCPNRFIKNPANRKETECVKMRTLWHWSMPGLSPSKYYRTIGDVWSQLGFVLPLDKGKPMRINYAAASGSYITKYLQKEHKEWHHRMKCTRNLGLQTLKKVLNQMKTQTLLAMTWRPKNYSLNHLVSKIHSVPLGLLRSLTKPIHFYRIFKAKQLDFKNLTNRSSEHYPKMLHSVRSGIRPERMPSQEFYDWLSQFLPEQTGYCENKLIEAHEQLRAFFPKTNYKTVHQSIAGNNIGFT